MASTSPAAEERAGPVGDQPARDVAWPARAADPGGHGEQPGGVEGPEAQPGRRSTPGAGTAGPGWRRRRGRAGRRPAWRRPRRRTRRRRRSGARSATKAGSRRSTVATARTSEGDPRPVALGGRVRRPVVARRGRRAWSRRPAVTRSDGVRVTSRPGRVAAAVLGTARVATREARVTKHIFVTGGVASLARQGAHRLLARPAAQGPGPPGHDAEARPVHQRRPRAR